MYTCRWLAWIAQPAVWCRDVRVRVHVYVCVCRSVRACGCVCGRVCHHHVCVCASPRVTSAWHRVPRKRPVVYSRAVRRGLLVCRPVGGTFQDRPGAEPGSARLQPDHGCRFLYGNGDRRTGLQLITPCSFINLLVILATCLTFRPNQHINSQPAGHCLCVAAGSRVGRRFARCRLCFEHRTRAPAWYVYCRDA